MAILTAVLKYYLNLLANHEVVKHNLRTSIYLQICYFSLKLCKNGSYHADLPVLRQRQVHLRGQVLQSTYKRRVRRKLEKIKLHQINLFHRPSRQAVQVTSKATLVAKQWLLSCFAPFEGDVILPNYIEDQSFEEVRAEWYTGRAANTQHLAQQKFNQAWAAAQEMTMKMVIMDQSVQAYLVNTFGVDAKRKPAPATSPAVKPNPFASALTTSPTSTNIFGQSQASPFGAPSNSQPSPFGAPSNSPAAAVPATTPQFGNSIFGGAQQHQQQTTGNIFGGGGVASPVSSQNTGNIFGQAVVGQQQQQPSFFGGSSPQVGGGQSMFGQQAPTAAAGGNIFGQAVTSAPTGNIFGQSQQPAAVQSNVFQQTPPAFGQSIFPANPQQPTPASNNIFGQPALAAVVPQQPAQPPPPNPFQQQQSPFGQQQTNTPTATSGGNVFGNVAQNAMQAAESSVFGQSHNQTQPMQPTQQQPPNNHGSRNAFGGQSPHAAPLNSSNVYSKMENLKPEQLQAFQARDFELGSIPNCPPPRELCF